MPIIWNIVGSNDHFKRNFRIKGFRDSETVRLVKDLENISGIEKL